METRYRDGRVETEFGKTMKELFEKATRKLEDDAHGEIESVKVMRYVPGETYSIGGTSYIADKNGSLRRLDRLQGGA